MCWKGTQNWFCGPNLFHHRNFKSCHTSTRSHMFLNVKGHVSTMLNNLNLHPELVWIWVEYFCSCTLHSRLKSNDFFPKYHLCMIFYHMTWCCLENFQENFENISVSLNFKFILNFLACIHWFLDLNFEIFSAIFGIHFLFGLRIFLNISAILQPGIQNFENIFENFSLRSYFS